MVKYVIKTKRKEKAKKGKPKKLIDRGMALLEKAFKEKEDKDNKKKEKKMQLHRKNYGTEGEDEMMDEEVEHQ